MCGYVFQGTTSKAQAPLYKTKGRILIYYYYIWTLGKSIINWSNIFDISYEKKKLKNQKY
jgi:hypothetical protein